MWPTRCIVLLILVTISSGAIPTKRRLTKNISCNCETYLYSNKTGIYEPFGEPYSYKVTTCNAGTCLKDCKSRACGAVLDLNTVLPGNVTIGQQMCDKINRDVSSVYWGMYYNYCGSLPVFGCQMTKQLLCCKNDVYIPC